MRALDAGRILGPCPGDTASRCPGEAALVGDSTGSSASRASNKGDVPHRKECRNDHHLRRPGHRSTACRLPGRTRCARIARLRGDPARPQRADRPPPGSHRPLQWRRRRRRGGQLRTRARPLGVGARRRPQRLRRRHERRRHRDRPLGDARRPRRSGREDRPRAGRSHLGRRRPRDPALRAGHAGRRRLLHRRRRADLARRLGLDAAEIRLLRRQSPLGRHRHRRRPGPDGERDGAPRPLLGDPRRRQQLRGRHFVRVPAARGRAARRLRGPDVRPGGRRTGRPGLARLHERGSRRGQFPAVLVGRPGH